VDDDHRGLDAAVLAIVVVFFSAIVDVIVAWLDPRLRQPGPST
jgi:ABC-type dipeptide/oligopeptide/nickel transport system permease component